MEALQNFHLIWNQVNLDVKTFSSFEIMETCLKEAESIFRKVNRKTADIFSINNEQIILVLISVGLVYQTQRGWDEACL
jgi:ppGpp synthetase/RelA/SpoT-type nucleotidyltranferase